MERIASHCLSGTHGEAEAIAATYLRLADGDARVALELAVADALNDIDAAQREFNAVARWVSRGYARCGLSCFGQSAPEHSVAAAAL
ncbi:hypothetical protein [Methylobacterium nigriterrae]|uniref:hypothetical protein n=1 Tax=Methylobacterium nigriterrae TaxID=3127512 RepID=UPI003013C83E